MVTTASRSTRPTKLRQRGFKPTHKRRMPLSDYVNMAPAVLLYSFFVIMPAVVVLVLSFFSWDGSATPRWVGLQNWSYLLKDGDASHAVLLTVKFTVISWVFETAVAMVAGIATARSTRLARWMSYLLVIPLLLSTAGVAVLWQALLSPSLGGLADVGTRLHLGILQSDWLGNPSIVLYVIAFIVGWQNIPFHMLLYRAGRQQVPESLYEAASLDGATGSRLFIHITLPQLRNTILTSSLLMVVGTFSYFDLVFLLTTGGPGTSSTILAVDVYKQGFAALNFGYSSALAVMLVVVSMAAGMLLMALGGFSLESRRGGE
jgi:ABC-type sugar transport system permease subunit